MRMQELLFGTAGTPISSKSGDSVSGIERIKELDLGCMEIEFVRGVRMGEEAAKAVRSTATKLGVALSVHAPYYINLNASEKAKINASVERILQSARIGATCGARNIVFHPAYYQKDPSEAVYARVKRLLEEMTGELRNDGISVVLRPETTGKATQFGSLDELLKISAEVDGVLPCIDFSHLHARTGKNNSGAEFSAILAKIEKELGKRALEDMQIHISGIEYTPKGEKRHLNLMESDLKYKELLRAWKEFDIKGLVICESPNLEGDAMLLRNAYAEL